MPAIKRTAYLRAISASLKESRITAILGPRQVGKSTLAKRFSKKFKQTHFFDLEDPTDFDLLQNPKLTLQNLEGLIIIDEIQLRPEIFPYLRVKADKLKRSDRILILGSASRDLLELSAETLAGRIRYIELMPFSIEETQGIKKSENIDRLFLRGGFPPSFLSSSDDSSFRWRHDYIQSYCERDLRTLGIDLPTRTIRRFLEMLVGFHGQIFNASEIGRSLGLSHTTARKYLDILCSTFLVRELKPYSESILQRQVKQPKIYIRDSGITNSLLGITSRSEIQKNPRLGALWEGFALEETIKLLKLDADDLYFWALHQIGEIDLLWKKGDRKIGFEFKYADSPKLSASVYKAIEILKLEKVFVIYPGSKRAMLDQKIELLPLNQVSSRLSSSAK